jgi:hypothetical protein
MSIFEQGVRREQQGVRRRKAISHVNALFSLLTPQSFLLEPFQVVAAKRFKTRDAPNLPACVANVSGKTPYGLVPPM